MAAAGSSAPPPSQLVFLSDLPSLPVRTKVRFLGCIQSYNVRMATLVLTHTLSALPTASSAAAQPFASTDIELCLPSIPFSNTDIGTWVNVIGYVAGHGPDRGEVRVQATLMWDAGAVRLNEYESVVRGKVELDGNVRDGVDGWKG